MPVYVAKQYFLVLFQVLIQLKSKYQKFIIQNAIFSIDNVIYIFHIPVHLTMKYNQLIYFQSVLEAMVLMNVVTHQIKQTQP